MRDDKLLELEAAIRQLPGILGCVILLKPDGLSGEIQAFARVGVDRVPLQAAVLRRVEEAGLADRLRTVHVFELDAESMFGDRQTLDRAAELAEQEARARGPLSEGLEVTQEVEPPPSSAGDHWRPQDGLESRPLLQRVVLSASTHRTDAQVSLGAPAAEHVVGEATGDKTPHGLKVVAEATLDACQKLVTALEASVGGASLVTIGGEEAVVVLVRLGEDFNLVGSALLRSGPASEAAVRASLDAVNRVLLRRP